MRFFSAFIAFLVVALDGKAATIVASSSSYDDVSSAIASASALDTVRVPAGESTWGSTLNITKGIYLRGAGTNSTKITANLGLSDFVVYYNPTPNLNEPFRLSGFTFDMQSNSLALMLYNNDSLHPLNKVRIDHNCFTNCARTGPHFTGFEVRGPVWGVMDHNYFHGWPEFHFDGNQADDWDYTRFYYGTTNTMVVEDNIFLTAGCIIASGWGSRYVARYNTTELITPGGMFPWFDAHGNQPAGVYGTMGVEVYGNLLNAPLTGLFGVQAYSQRGGKGICFGNLVIPNVYTVELKSWEEYTDAISPTTNEDEPQHVNDSYYWNNRKAETNGALWVFTYLTQETSTDVISPNVDFWVGTNTFDGTTGLGYGPLESRPATCTTGVAYWATDQPTDSIPLASCGQCPSMPLSGTLYKATAPDTWIAYYTPLVYPHPLVTYYDGRPMSVTAGTLRAGSIQGR